MAYDSNLDVESRDKLHFKLAPAVAGHDAHGDVNVRAPIAIHAGADADSSVVGTARSGASYAELGTFGAWTKVKLNATGTKVGFLPSAAVYAGGTGMGSYAPFWNSTPPQIALDAKTLDDRQRHVQARRQRDRRVAPRGRLRVRREPSAKVEAKKVFYRSNRGGKDGRSMSFTADIPMYPGSNAVTVIARESSEVRSTKTLFVYRDPPRTAQTP